MAITYGFFNSVNKDRLYNAAQIGKYLQYIVSDGVYAYTSSSLQVLANDGMDVQVEAGRAMLDHHFMENDAPISLTLAAGGSQDRVDAVVMYVDMTERACGITIKQGAPAASPTAPAMTRTDVRKEYMLAAIRVPKLSTSISQANITDTRPDSTVCGWVTGLIKQVDTSTLFTQWQTAYEEELAKTQDYLAAQQAAWEAFFQGVTEDNVLPAPSLQDIGKAVIVNEDGTGYTLGDSTSTDPTLSLEGKAADAAATGRALRIPNLLNNSNFADPVNSNGADQYDLGGVETIDRWKKRGTGVLTIVKNEGLQITSVGEFAGLFQTIENGTKRLAGKTVTLAAYVLQSPGTYEMLLGNSNNDVTAGTPYGEMAFTGTGLVVSSVTLPETFGAGDYLNFFIGEGDAAQTPGSVLEIAWCALYEGAYTAETLPVYRPRGYALEAAICGGGGGGLNFKVVGGTAQPSNPAENTIWVNTSDTAISYIFSATAPAKPTEGMVWIPTGTSSDVYFNALKKNGIQVYPQSVKQYINGEWVQIDAYMFQNGAWVQFSEIITTLYLYTPGNTQDSVTGGWKTLGAATIQSDYLAMMFKSDWKGAQLFTQNAIDMSSYKFLNVEVKDFSRTCYLGINNTKPNEIHFNDDRFSNKADCERIVSITKNGTNRLDIADAKGAFYVWLGEEGQNVSAVSGCHITDVWLS